jgi:L-lactate dehydrogenase complex protein LldG
MLATFQARAEAVSAEVRHCAGPAQAVEAVFALLEAEGVADAPGARAVWADGPLLAGVDRRALAARAPGLTFDVTQEAAAAARIGVTQVDWGVAATGTVAQAAHDVAQRLASTLPQIHVALLDPARIVPDLGALLARLGPAQSRYLTLVTGPSRTADIERVLTIGVHGPKRLVILLVNDLGGRS